MALCKYCGAPVCSLCGQCHDCVENCIEAGDEEGEEEDDDDGDS